MNDAGFIQSTYIFSRKSDLDGIFSILKQKARLNVKYGGKYANGIEFSDTLVGHEETSNVVIIRGQISEVEDKLVFKKLMTGVSTKYDFTFEDEGIRMRSFCSIGKFCYILHCNPVPYLVELDRV